MAAISPNSKGLSETSQDVEFVVREPLLVCHRSQNAGELEVLVEQVAERAGVPQKVSHALGRELVEHRWDNEMRARDQGIDCAEGEARPDVDQHRIVVRLDLGTE